MWIRPSVAACLGLATALSFSLGRSDDGLQLFHKMQDALGGSDDPQSGLPVRTTSISLSDPAHPIPSEEAIAERETVAGIRFVKRWTVLRSGVRVAEATVLQTTVNGGLNLADLVKPPPAAVTPR